jgi:NHLM bacteriocin system ABC transporter peptidase/ATP-binding protein
MRERWRVLMRWRGPAWWRAFWRLRPHRTRTVIQMEAVECGAACLGAILGYYGRFVPLEELRVACGSSRDGVTAKNLLRAAREYGLEAYGMRCELAGLAEVPMPCVLFWSFNHFVVLEGIDAGVVYINDPANGPRATTMAELDESFTGIALVLRPGPAFRRAGAEPALVPALRQRLRGAGDAVAFAVLAGLALVVPGLVLPAFTRVFVDQVLVQQMRSWVGPLLAGMLLTAVLRAASTWLREYVLRRLGLRLAVRDSQRFLRHLLRLPMAFYHQRTPGDLAARVALNDRIAQLLTGRVAAAAIDVALLACYVGLMLLYDWQITLLSVGVVAVDLVLMRVITRRRVDASRRLLQEQGRYQGALMGGLTTIETVKATSRESDLFAAFAGHQARLANTSQELARQSLALSLVPGLLATVGAALVLGLGGLHVMAGTLTLGTLVALQSLQSSLFEPVRNLVSLGAQLQEAVGEIGRLDDVLQHPVDPVMGAAPAPAVTFTSSATPITVTRSSVTAQQPSRLLTGRVELRGVTFGYSRLAPPLISDFNLTLAPGARVALVGASGSGKSTVGKLICRLYEPWDGEILFDGVPAHTIDRDVFSASVAFVDQELQLFSGTIRESITLWDPTIPDAQVVQAAKDAQVHDVIMARPGGYDAFLAEGGANLSGGQRQRLDLARALAASPRLLVLDEATSALDTVTEAAIDRALRRRGCTCLIVAHRLSTVRDCDEILVLDQGVVVQRGTHDALIREREGHYVRLLDVHGRSAERLAHVA